MDTQTIIKTLLRQNQARYDKLWDDLLKLSPEAFNQSHEPDNMSIADHLLVVVGELQRWEGFILGERDNRPMDLTLGKRQNLVEIYDQWAEMFAGIETLIQQQTAENLAKTLDGIQGPIWEVLIHMLMVAEEHHHYIVTILAQMGFLARPNRPNRDLWQFQTESLPDIRPQRTLSC